MGSGSPSAYLLWAILSILFAGFLLLHLWAYDRFECVRWGGGRQPGAFKRVMTYSYLMTLPLLVVYGVAMSVIKFKEGYVDIRTLGIIPKPVAFYSHANKRWLLPLSFVLSIGWSLEIVTHLEELAFWLFMIYQGPKQREWFHSWEYKVWCTGSMAAIIGLPMTVLLKRDNTEICQAWIFLVGSSASTATTICFLFVLWKFPGFLRHVKAGGADSDVIMRLTTFYQLNLIRVGFRFMFSLPYLTLALDGVQGPHFVIRHAFWTDFLFMIGSIGSFVSSAITLLIFFPRTPKQPEQIVYKDTNSVYQKSSVHHIPHPSQGQFAYPPPSADLASFRFPSTYSEAPEDISEPDTHALSRLPSQEGMSTRDRHALGDEPHYAYHRQAKVIIPLSRSKLARQQARTSPNRNLHPYVVNFTSPIDLPESVEDLPSAV